MPTGRDDYDDGYDDAGSGVAAGTSAHARGIDLLLKKERLASAGCPHYCVVDPAAPSITAWSLVDGEYETVAEAEGSEPFYASEPVDVRFTPAELI